MSNITYYLRQSHRPQYRHLTAGRAASYHCTGRGIVPLLSRMSRTRLHRSSIFSRRDGEAMSQPGRRACGEAGTADGGEKMGEGGGVTAGGGPNSGTLRCRIAGRWRAARAIRRQYRRTTVTEFDCTVRAAQGTKSDCIVRDSQDTKSDCRNYTRRTMQSLTTARDVPREHW